MADIIQFNQEEIKSQLGNLVKQTVEDTLNAMLDAEADEITMLAPGRNDHCGLN